MLIEFLFDLNEIEGKRRYLASEVEATLGVGGVGGGRRQRRPLRRVGQFVGRLVQSRLGRRLRSKSDLSFQHFSPTFLELIIVFSEHCWLLKKNRAVWSP